MEKDNGPATLLWRLEAEDGGDDGRAFGNLLPFFFKGRWWALSETFFCCSLDGTNLMASDFVVVDDELLKLFWFLTCFWTSLLFSWILMLMMMNFWKHCVGFFVVGDDKCLKLLILCWFWMWCLMMKCSENFWYYCLWWHGSETFAFASEMLFLFSWYVNDEHHSETLLVYTEFVAFSVNDDTSLKLLLLCLNLFLFLGAWMLMKILLLIFVCHVWKLVCSLCSLYCLCLVFSLARFDAACAGLASFNHVHMHMFIQF